MSNLTQYKKVIVIDDDPINNMICEKMVQHAQFADEVNSFLSALDALEWVKHFKDSTSDIFILLDINLPLMNGWEFLEQLQHLKDNDHPIDFSIYIHSSSVSVDDQQKAIDNPLVSGFILKPLTLEKLAQLK
jgi:CheY-like chemotaxis protein